MFTAADQQLLLRSHTYSLCMLILMAISSPIGAVIKQTAHNFVCYGVVKRSASCCFADSIAIRPNVKGATTFIVFTTVVRDSTAHQFCSLCASQHMLAF